MVPLGVPTPLTPIAKSSENDATKSVFSSRLFDLTSLWAWPPLRDDALTCCTSSKQNRSGFRFMRVEKCIRGLQNSARLPTDYVKSGSQDGSFQGNCGFFFLPSFFPTVFALTLKCRLACARQSRGCLCSSRASVRNGCLSVFGDAAREKTGRRDEWK